MRLLSPLVLHIGHVQFALATGGSGLIPPHDCNGNHALTRRWNALRVASFEVSAMSPMPLLNNFGQKIFSPKSFHKKSKSKIDVAFFQEYAAARKDTGPREESELFTNNSKI